MTIAIWASFGVALFFVPLLAYLGLLSVLASVPRAQAYGGARTRFVVVVPAHDEEAGIAATVQSALAVDYPTELRKVLVVADNCSDATAARAREAGALVLERQNNELRGKGYALELAFEHVARENLGDAVVVIDADSLASVNLLRSFDALLVAGEAAAQAEYGVRNPRASWRTRLMTVALAMFHRTRSLGRERLGLSCGLRGNGMCFSVPLLAKVPHKAYGLVEDLEYGILLGKNGYRVAYASDAWVAGEMVSGGKAAVSQRKRWEGGRAQQRAMVRPLIGAALAKRSAMLLDLAMDVLVPPLATLGIVLFVFTLLEAALWALSGFATPGMYLWAVGWACLFLYVVRGMQHSGLGFGAVTALAYAPVYVVWKLTFARVSKRDKTWVRTARE
ncbi:MAG: glycosyltransferase family 2 protein [Myxococcota bacterium]